MTEYVNSTRYLSRDSTVELEDSSLHHMNEKTEGQTTVHTLKWTVPDYCTKLLHKTTYVCHQIRIGKRYHRLRILKYDTRIQLGSSSQQEKLVYLLVGVTPPLDLPIKATFALLGGRDCEILPIQGLKNVLRYLPYRDCFVEFMDSHPSSNPHLAILCRFFVPNRLFVDVLRQNRLIHDMEQLLGDSESSDVTFLVDNQEINAHRTILAARSPVFRAMFRHHDNIRNEFTEASHRHHDSNRNKVTESSHSTRAVVIESPDCYHKNITNEVNESSGYHNKLALFNVSTHETSNHKNSNFAYKGTDAMASQDLCQTLIHNIADANSSSNSPANHIIKSPVLHLSPNHITKSPHLSPNHITNSPHLSPNHITKSPHLSPNRIAKSPVLHHSLDHQDNDANRLRTIEIADSDAESFEALLGYLYTGRLRCMSPGIAQDLLTLADKYDVQDLKNEVSDYLLCNLSVDSVLRTLVLADRHREQKLKEEAVDFVAENLRQVMKREEWAQFQLQAHLIGDILRSIAGL